MKKLIVLLILSGFFFSCKNENKTPEPIAQETVEVQLEPISKSDMETAVIYEANIRQYSSEGTFSEFTKDIPQLKELGVKVVWLMPVFPISETKRKATGGPDSKFASDFPEEEQSKYLGSYYAVTDYTKINPEFGTIEDFRELVKTAHDNGIYVILDWVPNHTGWDHVWIKEHPDYYTQNENGEIIHPEGTDWTDTADLNYDNQNMRNEMIEDMLYWVKEENIDGFRCDVAGSVPTDFWADAIPKIRAAKPVFMLAEAHEAELLKGDQMFDMCYGWDFHHLMNGMAQGKKSLEDFDTYFEERFKNYEADDILMNFVTNHDENSWNGTIKERMGEAAPLMTTLSYVVPGMPLIYSGQEYGMDHRLKFFEKDSIPKTKGAMWDLLVDLGEVKNSNAALNAHANFEREPLSNANILKITRDHNGQKITFIGNVSADTQTLQNGLQGKYLNTITNEKEEYEEGQELTFKPWEFKLLID